MSQLTHEKPIRAGIFGSLEHAEDAVKHLVEAGFDEDQITVICSDEIKEHHFERFRPSQKASESSQSMILKAGIAGGALGAVVAASGLVTSDSTIISFVMPILLGGITGTLLGLLVGRGVEDELARFYDQSVGKGEILVAVDINEEDDGQHELLEQAARILKQEGTKPFPLEEG